MAVEQENLLIKQPNPPADESLRPYLPCAGNLGSCTMLCAVSLEEMETEGTGREEDREVLDLSFTSMLSDIPDT